MLFLKRELQLHPSGRALRSAGLPVGFLSSFRARPADVAPRSSGFCTDESDFFFFFYSFCGYRDQLCANLFMCVPFKIFYAFNIVVKMPFEIFLPVSLMAEFVVCLHFNEPAFVKRSFPISFFFLLRHTPDSGQRRGRLRAHLPRALFQTIIHGFAQRIHV